MSNAVPPVTAPAAYEEEEVDLRAMFELLIRHRWLGLSVSIFIFLSGLGYFFVATPIYRVDALIQVEEQKSMIPGMQELSDVLGSRFPQSQAQIEVIKSRSVLQRVVSDLRLDKVAYPRFFPIIGRAIVRYEMGEFFRPLFSGFAWGGESINLGRLEVPESLKGKRLILKVGKEGAYSLYSHKKDLLLEGHVGVPEEKTLEQGKISLFIRAIDAPEGIQFKLIDYRIPAVAAALQEHLEVSEKGKLTGVIALSYEGPDGVKAASILHSIINNYIKQNVEIRSEQASKSLEFLNEQLPRLKQEVIDAEAALQGYKSSKGSAVDLSVEGEVILEQVSELEKRISELSLQRSELRARFTEESPAIATIDKQLGQLRASRSKIESRLKKMPKQELEMIRMLRNVKVANELYIQLLNKAQEFKVAKAGTIGDARIVDVPVTPWEPHRPKALVVLGFSAALAVILGVAAIGLRHLLMHTIETPEIIESQLGISVFATIPHSNIEEKFRERPRGDKGINLLCKVDAHDQAVESLRSLRTSLQFALLEAKNNIVSIHGPTPGIGKSFVASNLAFLISETQKTVLLIDADMRKGHIHKALGLSRTPGLSEVLAGGRLLNEVVHKFEDGRLDFLTTGKLPPNPADLLVHQNFQNLLNEASAQYDYVIIDNPPTLNLADSIVIGKLSGVNFLVVRGGINTMQDVKLSQHRLVQSGVRLDGAIFNDLSVAASKYSYGSYYSYSYKPNGKA